MGDVVEQEEGDDVGPLGGSAEETGGAVVGCAGWKGESDVVEICGYDQAVEEEGEEDGFRDEAFQHSVDSRRWE